MIKKLSVGLLLLTFAFPVTAQVTSTVATPQTVRQSIQSARTEAGQLIENARQAALAQIQNAREDFQQTISAKRAELQTALRNQREALKTKLQSIRDTQKRAIVERLDQALTDLNGRMTAHYVNVLDQMTGVLDRIVSRAAKAQTNGKDVSAVDAAIQNAQSAIVAARTAVAAQVGKTYPLNITTETALKNNVGAARQALQTDLKSAEGAVKAARAAVQQAAVTLGQIPGIDDLKTPTSTTTSVNQ